jgi:hypothetical protein
MQQLKHKDVIAGRPVRAAAATVGWPSAAATATAAQQQRASVHEAFILPPLSFEGS